MVIRKNKQGQAAIEFLMTYGWMLLVVLIVGALIFSFVDFDSLLPNKVDLSGSLTGDPSSSVAYADNPAALTDNENDVKIVFKYVGAKRGELKLASSKLELGASGTPCDLGHILNLDTADGKDSGEVAFLNGQTGILNFTCANLIAGDVVEGTLNISVEDPKTGFDLTSTGSIRLQIQN